MPGISRGQVIQRNRVKEQFDTLNDSLQKALSYINQRKQIDIMQQQLQQEKAQAMFASTMQILQNEMDSNPFGWRGAIENLTPALRASFDMLGMPHNAIDQWLTNLNSTTPNAQEYKNAAQSFLLSGDGTFKNYTTTVLNTEMNKQLSNAVTAKEEQGAPPIPQPEKPGAPLPQVKETKEVGKEGPERVDYIAAFTKNLRSDLHKSFRTPIEISAGAGVIEQRIRPQGPDPSIGPDLTPKAAMIDTPSLDPTRPDPRARFQTAQQPGARRVAGVEPGPIARKTEISQTAAQRTIGQVDALVNQRAKAAGLTKLETEQITSQLKSDILSWSQTRPLPGSTRAELELLKAPFKEQRPIFETTTRDMTAEEATFYRENLKVTGVPPAVATQAVKSVAEVNEIIKEGRITTTGTMVRRDIAAIVKNANITKAVVKNPKVAKNLKEKFLAPGPNGEPSVFQNVVSFYGGDQGTPEERFNKGRATLIEMLDTDYMKTKTDQRRLALTERAFNIEQKEKIKTAIPGMFTVTGKDQPITLSPPQYLGLIQFLGEIAQAEMTAGAGKGDTSLDLLHTLMKVDMEYTENFLDLSVEDYEQAIAQLEKAKPGFKANRQALIVASGIVQEELKSGKAVFLQTKTLEQIGPVGLFFRNLFKGLKKTEGGEISTLNPDPNIPIAALEGGVSGEAAEAPVIDLNEEARLSAELERALAGGVQ